MADSVRLRPGKVFVENTPPSVPTNLNVPPLAPAKSSGFAVASLVLGILSVIGGALLFLPPLLAVVFGHVSLSQCKRNPALTGRGLGIAGLVLGYVTIIPGLFFSIGLFAAMAIPSFQKVRSASIEKAVYNDARQIGAATQQFFMETGNTTVSFEIDSATGKVSGPLGAYVTQVTKGVRAVDGTINGTNDTFSLRAPNDKTYTFDADGHLR